MVFHISYSMLIYFLISLSVGIEGGYNSPAVGFNDIHSGVALTVFVSHHGGVADVTFSLGTTFHSGDNTSYSLTSYGLRCGFSKNNWLFSPIIEFGGDYANRKIHDAHESGYAFNYALGLLVNFHKEKMRIYPKVYYEGITDFKEHGGFIGAKLGIAYEI